MKKSYTYAFVLLTLITVLAIASSQVSLAIDAASNTVSARGLPPAKPVVAQPALPQRITGIDPIRFIMRVNKQTVVPGEEVTLTITATYLTLGSSMLFTFGDAKEFRLRVLLPKGFVQTGGDYIDYIGTALSPEKPTAVYTLKGYFTDVTGDNRFRLLRGGPNADAGTLFVEKSQVPVTVHSSSRGARLASTNGVALTSDCGTGMLTITGYLAPVRNPNVTIVLYKDNAFIGSISDISGPSFSQTYPISGSGSYYARVVEVNNDVNNVTATTSVSCSSVPNPPSNPNPPTNPTPPSDPTPPSNGSTLAFQIVSYDCTTGVLLYQITGGNGSAVFLNMAGIISDYVSAGTVYRYVFPGDGRQGRTVNGLASQAGQQIAINFTNSCSPITPTSPNPPVNPTPPTDPNPPVTPIPPVNPTPPTDPNPPVTPPTPPVDNCNGTGGGGLTGSYVNGVDPTQPPVTTRVDAQINFIWSGSPIPGVVNPDNFSIRWTGQVEAPVTGLYTFKSNNDDGTRVWVNGKLLIDDFRPHAPLVQQGTIQLTAGQKYSIMVDFVQYFGSAQAQLSWEYPGQASQIIPSCKLYPK